MPTLTKTDAASVIRNKFPQIPNFEVLACEDRSISDISKGFLSSSGKVTIVFDEENVIRELNVFVKGLPEEENIRDDVLSLDVWRKEALVYNMFLNRLKVKSCEPFFPECYLARCNDIIIIDDLSTRGYRNLPMLVDYDLEHCKKTIESIAKLHAASFIYEKNNNCKLNEYIPELNIENIFSTEENHIGRKRHFVGIKSLKRLTETYLLEYPPEVVREAFDFMEILPEKLVSSETFPNVISHCDLWNNNIMFKYDSDGKPSSACLVDFQLCTYRPPSFDLQVFLHCCTGKEFRDKNYKLMLEHYYSQLKQELFAEDIDINTILPKRKFIDMCHDTLPLALSLAAQFIHFVGIPDHLMKPISEDKDLWDEFYLRDSTDIVLRSAEVSPQYKSKVLEALSDLLNYFESV